MKSLLTILTGTLIATTVAPLTNTKINNKSKINTSQIQSSNNYAIVKPLDFNFYRWGYISDGTTRDMQVINLVNYKKYANTWKEFTNKYHTLNLLNFNAQEGGQSDTVTRNKYQIDTKDIKFNKTDTILNYKCSNPFVNQTAKIKFSFIDQAGNLLIRADFNTDSHNAVYHVWESLSFSDIIFNK